MKVVFLPYFSRDKNDAEDEEKNENEKNNVVAPKKQPLSLEEMIARRDAEKKAQEKVFCSNNVVCYLKGNLELSSAFYFCIAPTTFASIYCQFYSLF